MTKQLKAYIIMEPNGAGKSTYGYKYTKGVPVYDPDKRRLEIENKFYHTNRVNWPKDYQKYPEELITEAMFGSKVIFFLRDSIRF